MADLLVPLRTHLVSQGVARVPSTAGSAAPLWIEPRNGVPAPGEGSNPTEVGPDVVLGVYQFDGIPAEPFESELRTDAVEFRIRTRKAPFAFEIEAQIRAALIDRRHWTMGGLYIVESKQWRALARFGSDDQGFTHLTSYLFDRRA
jgi:hypothetical protein